MALITARELDHEPQVRVDQPLLCGQIATLDQLRQLDLLLAGQQRIAAGLVGEELEAVRGLDCGAVLVAATLAMFYGRRLDGVVATLAVVVVALSCSAPRSRHQTPLAFAPLAH